MKAYLLLFTILFATFFRAYAQDNGCIVLESECFTIKYSGVIPNVVNNTAQLSYTVTAKCDVPFNNVLFQLPEGITPTGTQTGNTSFSYEQSFGTSTGSPLYPFIMFTASESTQGLFRQGESDVFTYTIPLDQFHKMNFQYTTIGGGPYNFTVCLNPQGCTNETEIPEPECVLTTEDGNATFGFIDAVPISSTRTRVRFSVENHTEVPIEFVNIETRIPANHLSVAPTNALGQYAFIYLWEWDVDFNQAVTFTKINPEGGGIGFEKDILTFIISTDTYQQDPFFQLTMVTQDFASFSFTGFYTDGDLKCQDDVIVPLPVTLSSFSGKAIASGVELNWTTASERDNDRFEIQRSTDGQEYTTIGTVKGAGNSSSKLNYSYTDNSAVKGTNYYRLRQVDYDGENKLSRVIAIENSSASAGSSLSVYPNPTSGDNVTIVLGDTSIGSKSLVVSITDINGRKVFEKLLTSGDKEINISLPELNVASGLYLIRVQGEHKVETQKLIVR